MRVIGFNFTRIEGSKESNFNTTSHSTNIEFISMEKTNLPMIESEAMDVGYQYKINYLNKTEKGEESLAEIIVKGSIIITLSKQELKDILKSWKKKQIPEGIKISLFKIILKKSIPKAVMLADELSIPSPLPLPAINSKN